MRDNRDPTLLAVEMTASRRPGERLSQAADRLPGVDVPDYGTEEAETAYARLNGNVERATRALRPR